MAIATLKHLAGRVREDLEGHFAGRPAQLAERLREVLDLIVTAETPEPLEALARSGRVRGLTTHLNALAEHMETQSRLPEALCARYKYRISEAKARKRYKISRGTWRYMHDLAGELAWQPELHISLMSYETYPWHDELEQRHMSVEVMLDHRALEGMLLCALEAYLSPRQSRRKGYEVYGLNLGMIRDAYQSTPRGGLTVTRYVSVMRSHPQLSAEAGAGFVVPNERSLDAILGATSAFYPQYQAVGDFHSHTYDDLATMDTRKGWGFSPADEDANVVLSRSMAALGHRIHVSFVIAVARCAQKAAPGHYKGMKNTFQMSLGPCRAVVAAYRSLGSGHLTESRIRFRLPAMIG